MVDFVAGPIMALVTEDGSLAVESSVCTKAAGGFFITWTDVATKDIWVGEHDQVGTQIARRRASVISSGYAGESRAIQIQNEIAVAWVHNRDQSAWVSCANLERQALRSTAGDFGMGELPGGKLILVWSDGVPVNAQVFDAKVQEVGQRLTVEPNSPPSNYQRGPVAVTGLSSGAFVACWHEANWGSSPTQTRIRAKLVNQGSLDLLLDNFGTSNWDPSALQVDGHNFRVLWRSGNNSLNWKGFSLSGAGIGAMPPISNSLQFAYIRGAKMCMLANSRILVCWHGSQADMKAGIRAQVFDAGPGKGGAEIEILKDAAHNPESVDVAAIDGGGFVVVWRQSLAVLYRILLPR